MERCVGSRRQISYTSTPLNLLYIVKTLLKKPHLPPRNLELTIAALVGTGFMARPLPIHVGDGWYQVMSRGNGGEDIYRRDEDRRRFFGLLPELPERFGTEIHAFVLMDNHYHLLGAVPSGSPE